MIRAMFLFWTRGWWKWRGTVVWWIRVITILFAVLLAAGALIGCPEKPSAKQHQITYIRDTRTGLCFAVYRGFRSAGMVLVPCKAIKDGKW